MYKKNSFFFIILALVSFSTYAQRTSEFGLFLGRAYYLGEVNPKTHLGNGVGSLVYGVIYRYNLNPRYSLKASLVRTKVVGDDPSTEFSFNQFRNVKFETKLTEISGQIEFNFLPYETGDSKHIFSPYLFVGISAYNYKPKTTIDGIENEDEEVASATKLAMPFGPGLKLSMGNKLSLAFEWGFRRTSNDVIDGLPNRFSEIYELGKTYDNDWYVISGFMLTYKLTRVGPCPVYRF